MNLSDAMRDRLYRRWAWSHSLPFAVYLMWNDPELREARRLATERRRARRKT